MSAVRACAHGPSSLIISSTKKGAGVMPKTARGSGKVKGQILAEYEGLTISVMPHKAKLAGKNRLWLQIRQNGDVKRWRVSASLSYARSADIQFEDSPGKDSSS